MKHAQINLSGKRIHKGFSLIEFLIALGILGVLISIASVSFTHLLPKYRLEKAVWEINSRMNYARYKALFEETKFRVKFETSSYSLEKFDWHQNNWKKERKYFVEDVILQANNTPTFHPKGTVSNLASVYISNSSGRYKMTVAISGRIKVVKL